FRTLGPAETYAAWKDRLADSEAQLDKRFVAGLKHGSTITRGQDLHAARRRPELWVQVPRLPPPLRLLLTPTGAAPAVPGGAPRGHRDRRRARVAARLAAVLLPLQPDRAAGRHRAGRDDVQRAACGASDRRAPLCRARGAGGLGGLRSRAAVGGAATCRGLSACDALPADLPGRRGRDGRALRRGGPGGAVVGHRVPLRHAHREHHRLLPDRPHPAGGPDHAGPTRDVAAHAHHRRHGRLHDLLELLVRDAAPRRGGLVALRDGQCGADDRALPRCVHAGAGAGPIRGGMEGRTLAMRKLDGEQVLMRIFIGESDRWEHRPLHAALLELFRTRGLAGTTILRGVAGFGANSVVHTANILRLSADLPLVIEIVDSQEHLDSVLPDVERMMQGGLVTLEKVRVLKYDRTPA